MKRIKVKPFTIIMPVIFIALLYPIVMLDLSSLGEHRIWVNVKVLSTILLFLIPLVLILIVLIGLVTNRWAFKIERVSFGGFNIMFDNPVKLYKRSVRSFLDTKRTLFNIDYERDNFEETLTSYYSTYEFFRNEMKLLDNEKKRGRLSNKEQQELYDVTNQIIQMLNQFLTTHQNNFRRWYKHISETNKVPVINESGELEFHLTPINEVQRHYYRYSEICQGFDEINSFFKSEVARYFEVNLEKWKRVDNDA